MTIYSILQLLVSLFIIFFGYFIYSKNKRQLLNRIFFGITISSFVWLFSYAIAYNSNDPKIAFLWLRFGYCGVIFLAIATLHYTIEFLKIKLLKKLVIANYISGFVLVSLVLFTTTIIKTGEKYFWGYYPIAGILHPYFLCFFIGLITFASVIMLYFGWIVKEKIPPLKLIQIRYVFLAYFVFNLASIDFLPNYGIRIYPFGYVPAFVSLAIVGYTIVRYRLMDIRIAITRAGLFIAVYTIVLGIPFALVFLAKEWLIRTFAGNWWAAPLGLMAGLATVGPFIYIYISHKAEARLLREQRRYQDTLKQASIGMTRIRDLRKLLNLIAHIVTKTVRLSYAAIYLFDEERNEYVCQVSRDRGRIPIPKIDPDNILVNWIGATRKPIVYEEIKHQMQDYTDPQYKHLEEVMRALYAAVIIPTFLETKFIGFIVLGDKLSGQMYSPDDLDVFQVLSSQAALAIENAQFYEEAQAMQDQIAQAEKMATIGTMADGLSHQINNRFYALSLIAGDTIDTIKMTDISKCTPEVQEMVKQIQHALDRIQSNVMQGGEVVKGILKYTRKGDKAFEALALDQIIDGTLDMVQYKVKLSEIDIIRDYPKDLPKIKGNMVQLQEVFFNFIDNGYDSMVERRTTLKEPGYRGKIRVSATAKDSTIEILIEDNGMGVRDEDKKKIFTPFFTTKVSSRKGTGLGLYVVRKIIIENHLGTINFESEHKVGTRFIVELPIA
ncbi:MAG: ATP-binding protein [Candidatus Omnitrophota bacterium]